MIDNVRPNAMDLAAQAKLRKQFCRRSKKTPHFGTRIMIDFHATAYAVVILRTAN